MLRRILIVPALCAGLLLPGCATTGPGGTVDPVTAAGIIQNAKSGCQFEPLLETVTAIVGALTSTGPVMNLIDQGGQAICATVGKLGAKRGADGGFRTVVNGRPVVVRGTFVR